jgi:hypothetical protein
MPQDAVQQEPGKFMDITNENEPMPSIETYLTPHSSPLTGDEKEIFSNLSPLEKIGFFRNRAQQRKGSEEHS